MEPFPTPGQPEAASGSTGESIEALEQQLTRAQAELAEYQAMLDELPAIYETKFRHQLQVLAQDIRRLMDERRALQEQLAATLPAAEPQPALPPATTDLAAVPTPPRRPRSLRLKRWRRGLRRRWETIRAAAAHLPSSVAPPRWPTLPLPRRGRLPLLVLGTVGGVALLVVLADVGLRRLKAPTQAPGPSLRPSTAVPAANPSTPRRADQDLLLRARGESWVQVEKLDGEVVYTNTLQEGDLQRIRLRDGLKVRSGRPDLLDVA
ncbi:RodZ domain-containing protein, partial [Aphanothece stagnina]